jgi:DNA processing protein
VRAADDERLARLALSLVSEPNDVPLWAAVTRDGPVETFQSLRAGSMALPDTRHYLTRLGSIDARRCLDAGESHGARFVVPGDLEWPSQLADAELPQVAHHPPGAPPLGLWLRGPLHLRTTVLRSASVVGSRAASGYGVRVASELASGLADRGWAVVSGGAYGIDASAHRGALAAGGATVCVLACGVDLAYPRSNASLIERIADGGLLVSELAPGAYPTKARFLDRNRLIAALSPGTVLVEAAFRSGALNTASWATRMHRRLLAVPGPVTSPLSDGPHRQIRAGSATLVTGAGDVVVELGSLGDALAEDGVERLGEADLRARVRRADDGLDGFLRRTLDALSRTRWRTPDEVAVRAGIDRGTVAQALRQLETAGLATEREDRYRASP